MTAEPQVIPFPEAPRTPYPVPARLERITIKPSAFVYTRVEEESWSDERKARWQNFWKVEAWREGSFFVWLGSDRVNGLQATLHRVAIKSKFLTRGWE